MFSVLGKCVSRTWPLLLVLWLSALVVLHQMAPNWHEVAEDGEFGFLPKDSPSLKGEELFRKGWDQPLAGNVVIVVRRESAEQGLLDSDKRFIEDELKPRLEKIALEEAEGLQPQERQKRDIQLTAGGEEEPAASDLRPITVRTYTDRSVGKLLESDDKKASLVLLELPTEFLDGRNGKLIKRVESLIARDGELQAKDLVPRGLDLALSGSATVGRDMLLAATESSKNTEKWTVILVLLLLVTLYRAPLIAAIPLITVAVATEISLKLLAILAQYKIIGLFEGIEVFVKVLCYGSGVDYCLFLVARYREELEEGAGFDEAVANSLTKVGHALVASAGTVICGIGMMVFAEFGKFRQAGVAISLGLTIVLIASLTFTPSLLRLSRRWAFWPRIAGESPARTAGWVSATSLWTRFLERNWGQLIWNSVSEMVRRRPGTVLVTSTLIMLPFAWVGVQFHSHLSYGLLSELPRDTASVIGAAAVADHFAPGMTGPMTVLLYSPNSNFLNEDDLELSDDSKDLMNKLTDQLRERRERLQIADVRSLLFPYGGALTGIAKGESAKSDSDSGVVQASGGGLAQRLKDRIEKQRTLNHYVSSHENWKGKVLRLDLVMEEDPFARNSIAQFESIRNSIQAAVPASMEVHAIGPTANIRDLKVVTDRDQITIDVLVLTAVLVILLVLLRRVTISLYLIVSVFFSYLVTLGFTFTVFWMLDPSGFGGLDWKVPVYLFTILIAVGEDYNIFLMTRIDEEQRIHGPTAGVISALRKTGSIISSCGIIMAGTFCSLLAGSLVGLHQLGFALAAGVLLDTFVVRPILVPSFLVLLHNGRFNSLRQLFAMDSDILAVPAEIPAQPEVGGE